MRIALGLLPAVVLVMLSASFVSAQAPVSSLQPTVPKPRTYDYDVGLFVVPFGKDVPATDEDGRLFMGTRLEYTAGVHGSVRYYPTDRFAIAFAAGTEAVARRETVAGAGGAAAGSWSWTAAAVRPSVGLDWRFMPTSRLDPLVRLTTTLGDVFAATIAVDGRVITDPVVLSGGLAVSPGGFHGTGRVSRVMTTGVLGVAFVANDRVTVSASVRHVFPVPVHGVPQTNATVGVHYALNNEQTRAVAFDTTVAARGGDVRIGFGVTWSATGRGDR